MAQDFKRGVSPKAQKRMTDFKPVRPDKPTVPPPTVLPEDVDLGDAAFGKPKTSKRT